MLMTLAFVVVAFSAQALAWRCAKLSMENERLKEQLRQLAEKTDSTPERSTGSSKTVRPLVWD